MKESKLRRYSAYLLISAVFLGLEVGSLIALALYPNYFGTLFSFYPYLFLIFAILLGLTAALIVYLFARRARLLEERRSSSEFFQNERFVFTEARLKDVLAKKARHNRLTGVLAALSVKDINTDLLTLYGPEAVRSINEACLACLAWRFGGKSDCHYAYNLLDGFFVYKDTKHPESFYEELKGVLEDINAKLKENEALPSVKVIIGAYIYKAGEPSEQGFQKALYAENFNADSRLTDDVVVYNDEMTERNETQRALALELSRGLEKEEFEIFYQPKYRLKDKCYYGAEALIRWHHPTRGLLPPSLFIPFAEQSGAIIRVDYYVFEHVCQRIAEWKKNAVPLLTISVNLSRKTVYNPGLLDFFKRTTEKYGVDPRTVEIELTESIAAKDLVFVADMIMKLRRMGFRTAIDDFGVGYSSFASLKRIPFDTLKIDKTFIDDIEVNEKSRSLVRMVIDMSHSLGMETVAEGVQSVRQSQILQALKLDCIQGFYYARVLSPFDYVRFLGDHRLVAAKEVATKAKKKKEISLPTAEGKAASKANLRQGRGGRRMTSPALPSINGEKKEQPRFVSEGPALILVPEEKKGVRKAADPTIPPSSKKSEPYNPIVNLHNKNGGKMRKGKKKGKEGSK